MQQQQKSRNRGLGILAAKTQNRCTSPNGVVVNLANLALLPGTQSNLFSDITPLWNVAMIFNPLYVLSGSPVFGLIQSLFHRWSFDLRPALDAAVTG